jgi:DNA-binding MarR family transcriptional regulator
MSRASVVTAGAGVGLGAAMIETEGVVDLRMPNASYGCNGGELAPVSPFGEGPVPHPVECSTAAFPTPGEQAKVGDTEAGAGAPGMERTGVSTRSKEAGDEEIGLGDLSTAWNMGGPDYLSLRISFVAKLIERRTARVLNSRFGISVAEWRVLAQLARMGPMTVRELAERSWVDRAEVSRAAASLIARGDVLRTENPKDRRSPKFSATTAGRARAKAIAPTRDRFQALLAHQLSPTEMDVFLDGLLRLARTLVEDDRSELEVGSAGESRRPAIDEAAAGAQSSRR